MERSPVVHAHPGQRVPGESPPSAWALDNPGRGARGRAHRVVAGELQRVRVVRSAAVAAAGSGERGRRDEGARGGNRQQTAGPGPGTGPDAAADATTTTTTGGALAEDPGFAESRLADACKFSALAGLRGGANDVAAAEES